MAVFTKTVTLAIGEEKVLHRAAVTPFSVEIIDGRGLVRMHRQRNGLIGDAFADANFEFLLRRQTIPVGSIRAIPAYARPCKLLTKCGAVQISPACQRFRRTVDL